MGFTGQWLNVVTGLQYNHHRWYDPTNGRWLSEDPMGFAAGDGNLHRYVGNRLTTHLDPTGLATFQIGGSVDITGGPIHLQGDLSIYFGCSFNSYPFFTFGIGSSGGAGQSLGGGAGIGLTAGVTTARNVGCLEGRGSAAGINTPAGSVGGVSDGGYAAPGGDYVGVTGGVGVGPIADVHSAETATTILNTGSDGPGQEAHWVWPWDSNASWAIGDTWDVWFGGGE